MFDDAARVLPLAVSLAQLISLRVAMLSLFAPCAARYGAMPLVTPWFTPCFAVTCYADAAAMPYFSCCAGALPPRYALFMPCVY